MKFQKPLLILFCLFISIKATSQSELQKKKLKQTPVAPPKPKRTLAVGDSVRLEDGKTVGTIDKIEKNKAVVNYGLFTTSVNVNRLEYVSK